MTVAEHVRQFTADQNIPYEMGDEVQIEGGEPDNPSYVITPYNIRLDSHERANKTIGYPLVLGCLHFGMTGWDWLNQKTKWVLVADFDIESDGKKTPRTVTTEEMDRLIDQLSVIPWLTLKRSKGGNGVHAFAEFADPVPAECRGDHQSIAHAVRALVEQIIGEKLPADKTGSVAYVWTRHPQANSFALIREATEKLSASDLPEWESHESCDYESVELTERHKADLAILAKSPCPPQFDPTSKAYRVHTSMLHLIDANLKTISAGRDPSHPNAFMYPKADGSWTVYRYGGAKEHESWHHEVGKTWTVLNPIQFTPSLLTKFSPLSLSNLTMTNPMLNLPVIEGLVREGEVMNVIAAPKSHKTWMTYSIALSIAAGKPWFGFPTQKGKVLLLDNELHPSVIADRVPRVAKAMGITDYRDMIDVVPMRGRLLDLIGIRDHIVSTIERGHYQCVILDAWYRASPGGSGGENDNSSIASAFNLIDQFAAQTGAAWLLVHHTSKGDQSEKSVTDTGAGAGAQSRAADCHLILRPHEEPDCVVLDAVVRSYGPVEPVVLRWNFPVFEIANDLDPAALQQPRKAKQKQADSLGCHMILQALSQGSQTANGIAGKTPMGHGRITRLLGQLIDAGQVVQEIEDRGKMKCQVYRSVCS